MIVGKNNSGKTTALESLFLLSAPNNPRLIVRINAFRKLDINEITWNILFHQLDAKQPTQFRDADNDANAAFQSIQDINKKNDLPLPEDQNRVIHESIKAGIFIMPGNNSEGMLESLCLKTVSRDPRLACVDTFLACVTKCGEVPRNLHKSRAQAYLASMPKTVTSVGHGALEDFWDMNSTELDEIKSFLLQL